MQTLRFVFSLNGLGKRKGEAESWAIFWSLASLEEQVMLNPDVTTSCLVGVEMPAVPLEFFNCSADVVVVVDFNAYVFFQLNSPSVALEQVNS